MTYKELFTDQLLDHELFHAENFDEKYLLTVQRFYFFSLDINTSVIENTSLPLTAKLKSNLLKFYEEANAMNFMWSLDSSLLEDEELHSVLVKNGLIENFSIKDIVGTINISSPAELFDTKKYVYLKKDGVQYLPFDMHYGLAICFKVEDQIEDNLYIFNTEDSDNIMDMKTGCLEYLQLAYEAKLLYQWPLAYIHKNSVQNKFLNTVLPVIFPFLQLELSKFN